MSAPSPASPIDTVRAAANELSQRFDADVYLFNSGTNRPFDDEMIAACSARRRHTNVIVVLVSGGGDPDAAYRIARCFQQHYAKFTCIVQGYCKSAATMIVMGAHELVMTNFAEFGPLDVQMTKKDEIWEYESGLTVMAALTALQERSFSAFQHFLLTMKRGNRSVSYKMAADIAVRLTTGLFAPIYEHIDPTHIGEASRAQMIAQHYGLRLALYSKNISTDSLKKFISTYPSHGFVIDREEAEGLFNSVREPNELEQRLIDALGDDAFNPLPKEEFVRSFLSDEKEVQHAQSEPPSGDNSGAGVGDTGRPGEVAGKGIEHKHVGRRSATAS